MKVEFYRHHLGPEEINAVAETLQTLFLTTGSQNAEFERAFADYLGVKYVVSLASCTAALHLALVGLGIGPGDEVITTPMSFVATSNAVFMAGATPVFVDVDPMTGLIDLDLLEDVIGPRTRAVIPVHLYGQMVDMVRLRAIADRHGLLVIEDAAHAAEARRDGVQPGQLGDAACFSFYATKNITSGEGGALATNRPELDQVIRQLCNHGMSKSAATRYTGRYQHWDMERFGWKCNLSNFQAAMLIPQLARMDERLKRREEIAQRYEAAFTVMGIGYPKVLGADNRSGRHLVTIWADDGTRDDLLTRLQDCGIGVAVNYRAIHLTEYYRTHHGYEPGRFPEAERIGSRTVSLPFYPRLRDDEIEYVIAAVADARGRSAAPAR